jgi:serine/threonine-protein kinase HipA
LAPAYDLCHAYSPNHKWVSQHALSINGKRSGISKKDLLIVGNSIQCKRASTIIDEIETHVMNWKYFANEVDVSKKLSNAIFKTIADWN